MIDVKKWFKRIGLVFLSLVLVVVGIMFMPLVDMIAYYLLQLAVIAIQIALAMIVLRLSVTLVMWALGHKLVLPAWLTKVRQKALMLKK